MNEFIKELYSLDYGEQYFWEDNNYTRVPGGWLCEAFDNGSASSMTFIPFVKKEDL